MITKSLHAYRTAIEACDDCPEKRIGLLIVSAALSLPRLMDAAKEQTRRAYNERQRRPRKRAACLSLALASAPGSVARVNMNHRGLRGFFPRRRNRIFKPTPVGGGFGQAHQ
jgi:hypothetical protein